jgi:hypothetical protein
MLFTSGGPLSVALYCMQGMAVRQLFFLSVLYVGDQTLSHLPLHFIAYGGPEPSGIWCVLFCLRRTWVIGVMCMHEAAGTELRLLFAWFAYGQLVSVWIWYISVEVAGP